MKRLILILGIGLLLGSCKKETRDSGVVPGNSVDITFGLQLSGSVSPITRIGDVAKDIKIEDVTLLVFDNSENNGTGSYLRIISEIIPDTDGKFTASLKRTTTPVTIHVFANSSASVNADGVNGKTEDEAIKNLLTAEVDPSSFPTLLPMHSSLDLDRIDNTIGAKTVQLLRAVARVDIVASAVSKDFTLTEVRAYFTPKQGRLVSEHVADMSAPEVTAPTMPTDYDITEDTTHIEAFKTGIKDNSITNGVFIYENTNNRIGGSVDDITLNTRIVVGGMYEGKSCYYPIDFTATGGAFFNILRNQKYTLTITSVTGTGYETPHNAAYGISHNITVTAVGSQDWLDGAITIINPPSDLGVHAGEQGWGTGDETTIINQ